MKYCKTLLLIIFSVFVFISLLACEDVDGKEQENENLGDDDDNDDNDDDDNDDDNDNDDNDASPPNDWRFIKDEKGRALIFHGCNFDGSAKGDSGLPNLIESDAIELGDVWGFNFARYLIFWARIEPEAGVYDDQYLDDVETRLDWLHAAGMKIVLDMHQDLWGPFISDDWGGSDGAPEWATILDNRPHIPFGDWLGGWAYNYLSPAVIRAFDNFWDYSGHPELQDHYANMWVHVVERFKDHPAILGYDPMNEPWQGSDLLHYRQFDETKYTEFNQRMIDAIRGADTDGWIFYEPCAFGPNQGLPSFLQELNDSRQGDNRLAYFPHLYPAQIDLLGGYVPEKDNTIENWEKIRDEEIKKQRAPLLAGEWSMLFWFDDENKRQWTDEALRMMERVTSGWAYWECGWFLRDQDTLFQDQLASVYPKAVAGYPTSYGFNSETREFELIFEDRENVTGPTEIYLPVERNYQEGWALDVSDPAGAWLSDWDEDTQTLSVWTDYTGTEHTITIFPIGIK